MNKLLTLFLIILSLSAKADTKGICNLKVIDTINFDKIAIQGGISGSTGAGAIVVANQYNGVIASVNDIQVSSSSVSIGGQSFPREANSTTLVQDKEGNTYGVSETGEKVQVGKQTNEKIPNSGGGYSAGSDPTPLAKDKGSVTFMAHATQKYGFDLLLNPELANNYDKISGISIPWKSVKTAGMDKVTYTGTASIGTLKFRTKAGFEYKPENGVLNIIGTKHGDIQEIYAIAYQDSTHQHVIGKLQAMTLNPIKNVVYVIPTLANQTVDKAKLKAYLDKVYDQAAMHWEVEVISQYKPTITLGDNGLDIAKDESRKDLSPEMKALRDDYLKQGLAQKEDAQTYYVFLVDKFSDASIDGYFPQSKIFGFVRYASSESTLHKTLAHELGHGAGNLEHPFVQYKTTQGATPLLMDYSSGSLLTKQDWGMIHNPGIRTGWKDAVGEGQSRDCDEKLSYLKNLIEKNDYLGYIELLYAESSIEKVEVNAYGNPKFVTYKFENEKYTIRYYKDAWASSGSVSRLFKVVIKEQELIKNSKGISEFWIYYNPNTGKFSKGIGNATIALFDEKRETSKNEPTHCYLPIQLPYGDNVGAKFAKAYPKLIVAGAAVGASIYLILPTIAASAEVFTIEEEASRRSYNCIRAFTFDLAFQVAIMKAWKIYQNAPDKYVYGSDVSVLNAGASCMLSNIEGCDDMCLMGVNGLVGTFDDLYRQAILEEKDVSKLDIGRSLQMGTFQALVGYLANKAIIYSFNKLTSTQFKNLLDDIIAFPEKYGMGKVNNGGSLLEVTLNGKVIGKFTRGESLEIIDDVIYGGNKIKLTPNKTTTATGTLNDVNTIAKRGVNADGSFNGITNANTVNVGGINILRSPKWGEIKLKYKSVVNGKVVYDWEKIADEFWETVNKPWLDDAIARGDNFRFVSNPTDIKAIHVTDDLGNFVLEVNGNKIKSIFGREIDYLKSKGYTILSDGTAVK